jgi:predicted nucleic acid-binding protein
VSTYRSKNWIERHGRCPRGGRRKYLTPAIEDRALEVQLRLAERGHHRAPSIPNLLIAATEELAKLTVLHHDKDFELIAEVTGQPIEQLLWA